MSRPKPAPKTRRDLMRICRKSDKVVAIKEGSKHTKIKFEHGATMIPRHTGDIPTGTMKSILKAFAMAGITLTIVLGIGSAWLYDWLF